MASAVGPDEAVQRLAQVLVEARTAKSQSKSGTPQREKIMTYYQEFKTLDLVRKLPGTNYRVKYLKQICRPELNAWRAQGTLKGEQPTCHECPITMSPHDRVSSAGDMRLL